ncbi:site-specific integrase [Rheinheimera baltica]|uniref:site-specific integrase n=1 Tax=Rheinheimera baltica TaxID=67576 RepID=UPI000408D4CF|nr:site-specific integrase [Rheinheimera baltica]
MATLEHIHFVPHNLEYRKGTATYSTSSSRSSLKNLPQLFWKDGTPWREANLWAVERTTTGEASLKTVASNMNGLLNYAKFLESRELKWFEFPVRKAERCLVLYRGSLIKMRNAGLLSPSTASEYMRNCIMFYRWVKHRELLAPHVVLWREKPYSVKFFDQVGFERTISVITTDLSIPNRKRIGLTLENGLLPLSELDRDAILDLAAAEATPELYLMLALGFFTGMRLGSICDLKLRTLEHAIPDPSAKGLLRLAVGPGAVPPVHTKFGVTGQVWIPEALRDELLEYAKGSRRIARAIKAPPENRDLLFLTRYGNSYGRRGTDQSSAVNVEMSDFRKRGIKAGLQVLRKFRFHQSRCTFGTVLTRLALSTCADVALVIGIVSDALLHGPNSEATTLKYIRFEQALLAV